VTAGGGNADECELIEVVELSILEAKNYLAQKSVSSPGGFLFGLQWFLHNKAPLYAK
jgi:UDP-sugar diphosphatase